MGFRLLRAKAVVMVMVVVVVVAAALQKEAVSRNTRTEINRVIMMEMTQRQGIQ